MRKSVRMNQNRHPERLIGNIVVLQDPVRGTMCSKSTWEVHAGIETWAGHEVYVLLGEQEDYPSYREALERAEALAAQLAVGDFTGFDKTPAEERDDADELCPPHRVLILEDEDQFRQNMVDLVAWARPEWRIEAPTSPEQLEKIFEEGVGFGLMFLDANLWGQSYSAFVEKLQWLLVEPGIVVGCSANPAWHERMGEDFLKFLPLGKMATAGFPESSNGGGWETADRLEKMLGEADLY